jgi:hypothetical protein
MRPGPAARMPAAAAGPPMRGPEHIDIVVSLAFQERR